MANPQSTPEDLEAAYTLLLLSQDPVHFSAPTTLATFTGVEHESSNHSSKQVRMTRRGNKGPTASTRARSNQSDKTLTKGKNSHCGKEKAMKLTVSQEPLIGIGTNITLTTSTGEGKVQCVAPTPFPTRPREPRRA